MKIKINRMVPPIKARFPPKSEEYTDAVLIKVKQKAYMRLIPLTTGRPFTRVFKGTNDFKSRFTFLEKLDQGKYP
jgi:hypothetical protein